MNTQIHASVLRPVTPGLLLENRRHWAQECAGVIPCLNEAATIGEVVRSLRRTLPHVIVVDDGSGDSTLEMAAAAGADVIRHSSNAGKGRALRTGWQHALDRGFRWAMTLDGDAQHSVDDISHFLDCAERTNAPLIVGNRMNNANAIPWLRRQVNRWMSRQLSEITQTPLLDSQCGYRLVNLRVLSQVPLAACRFEIESEVLVNFVRAGHQVEFVPIQVIYRNRRSNIHPILDTWRWLRWHLAQRSLRACNTMRVP